MHLAPKRVSSIEFVARAAETRYMRTTLVTSALVALSLAACHTPAASDLEPAFVAPAASVYCSGHHGKYQVEATPLASTCADSTIVTVVDFDEPTPSCHEINHGRTWDGCQHDVEQTCDDGRLNHTRSSVRFAPGSDTGGGWVKLERYDSSGGFLCGGSYTLTVTRL